VKKPTALEQIQELGTKLNRAEREAHWKWVLNRCCTCGREGTWKGGDINGIFCDACCEEGMQLRRSHLKLVASNLTGDGADQSKR
jgi:hypothetical protein